MASTQEPVSRDELRSSTVASAGRLLQEEGAEAVTTRAAAQAAGVQAPTIYRLSGDKDGLVATVAEHVMATSVAAKSTAAHAAPVRTTWTWAPSRRPAAGRSRPG